MLCWQFLVSAARALGFNSRVLGYQLSGALGSLNGCLVQSILVHPFLGLAFSGSPKCEKVCLRTCSDGWDAEIIPARFLWR